MAAKSFFGGAFFGGEFFNTPATTKTPKGMEPKHDLRIMRDDEEVMRFAAMFVTMIDP